MSEATLKLMVYGVTDVGLVREHNEDCIDWDLERGLFLLADGMGGHNAGEVASDLAIQSVKRAMYDLLTPEVIESGVVDFSNAIYDAIVFANQEIYEQAQERPECAGMGTTLVVVLVQDNRAIIANVGDSRMYYLRDGKLNQITTDHSLVQEMVDGGFLTEDEAQKSVSRNLITRALGIADDVDVDLHQQELKVGDIFLMCSDGLTDLVTDEEISTILNENKDDLETAAQKLVNCANDKGGKDNTSVIIIAAKKAYSDEQGYEDSQA